MNKKTVVLKSFFCGLLFSCIYLFAITCIAFLTESKIFIWSFTAIVCLVFYIFKCHKSVFFIGSMLLWCSIVSTFASLMGSDQEGSWLRMIIYISAPTIAYTTYYVRSHKPSSESSTSETGVELLSRLPDEEAEKALHQKPTHSTTPSSRWPHGGIWP